MSWVRRFFDNASPKNTDQRSEGNQSPNIAHARDVNITYAKQSDPPVQMVLLPQTSSTRMHFRARLIPLLGRDAELQQLHEFLEANAPFKWWLIAGVAGMGKSRLALELCLRVQGPWCCGFLPVKSSYDGWQEWSVEQPWLIIVDYASTRAQELQTIVETLAFRAQTFKLPVRVLLVERSIDHDWWKEFLGTGSTRLLLESCCHAAPLKLEELPADALWLSVVERFRIADLSKLPSKEETLETLSRLDPLRRPLFAALAADALVAGRDIRSWDQATLLRDILDREEEKFWKPAGVTERDKSLLCFATIQGGMLVDDLGIKNLRDWGELPSVERGDPNRFSASHYEAMAGQEATEFLAPLKPDAVGEFFVLEYLTPTDSADRSRVLMMLVLAWIARPLKVFEFATRVLDDYPNHPSVLWLRFTLSNEGIKIMLELFDNQEMKNKLLYGLAPAKANLIRTLSRQGDTQQSLLHFNELVQLSDQFPEFDVLEKIVIASVSYVAIGFLFQGQEEGSQLIFKEIGCRWTTRGSKYEDFDLLVKASLLTAIGIAEDGNFAASAALCAEVVRLTRELPGPSDIYQRLPEEIRPFVTTLTERRAFSEATQVFDLLLTLPNASANGLVGIAFVLAFASAAGEGGLTDSELEMLRSAVESTKRLVLAPGFGVDVLEQNIIDNARVVINDISKILTTD